MELRSAGLLSTRRDSLKVIILKVQLQPVMFSLRGWFPGQASVVPGVPDNIPIFAPHEITSVMKTHSTLLLLTCLFLAPLRGPSQAVGFDQGLAGPYAVRAEVCFSFPLQEKNIMDQLAMYVSFDKVNQGAVHAYANPEGFRHFCDLGIPYVLTAHPGDGMPPIMSDISDLKQVGDWDFYPTYENYVSLMYQFQATHPDLCRVFSIGQSGEGRDLLFAVISDNVATDEAEPGFLFTSTIHGDETTGFILMMHLIDFLLDNYGSDPWVTGLVDDIEIWINPLANPDGTYAGGNGTVYGATRFNANGIDLNRNYADPQNGPHPDGKAYQAETLEFMDLADSIPFVMAVNIHGGEEVCNYPWDTWPTLHADDDWWRFVCREYADTVHVYAPFGYLNSYDNGITNGYAWYEVNGGRQDYMNYFHHCREFTLEISNDKLPEPDLLPLYWEYNYRSFLNYLGQCRCGIRGMVADSVTGAPIEAQIILHGHDNNNSFVFSSLQDGDFYRPVFEGAYDVMVSPVTGYYIPRLIPAVQVQNRQSTVLDIRLKPSGPYIGENGTGTGFALFPQPATDEVWIGSRDLRPASCDASLADLGGRVRWAGKLHFGSEGICRLDLEGLEGGHYLLTVITGESVSTKRLGVVH